MRYIYAASTFITLLLVLFLVSDKLTSPKKDKDTITIAILAKDKAHTLPLYLECLERQTWPKDQTCLYVKTNNNTDETADVLKTWIAKVGHSYKKIYFDESNVDVPVEKYKQHEWNSERFTVLGKIRQDSLDWAIQQNSHYFVADCDNFIYPDAIESLYRTNLPIVAPLLKIDEYRLYSNYHAAVDESGYYRDSDYYYPIFAQLIKGLIEVPVVHCTYFINKESLPKLYYNDSSDRHEYVIFSESARLNSIPQYMDNRKLYGRLTHAETTEELKKESLLQDFKHYQSGAKLI